MTSVKLHDSIREVAEVTTNTKRLGHIRKGMDLKLSNQNLKRKQRGRGRNRKEEGRGTEVATVRRNSERRKEMQEAEYRNRKKGMETGRREEEKAP